MHRAAADDRAAARTGTQFRQGHPHRHIATLSLPLNQYYMAFHGKFRHVALSGKRQQIVTFKRVPHLTTLNPRFCHIRKG
jgi:hypothetical protein